MNYLKILQLLVLAIKINCEIYFTIWNDIHVGHVIPRTSLYDVLSLTIRLCNKQCFDFNVVDCVFILSHCEA